MTTLEFFDFKIQGCNLGEESGLADMNNNTYIHSSITVGDSLDEEERKYIGKGMLDTVLPYTDQNQYDRTRSECTFKAAKLENEYLRAVFITDLGGRLWSLYDKKKNRELLYSNNCFQAGNLGIRNAWFSGGVEWNVGIKGHTPLTCSPLFAQKGVNEKGEPILSMYEFERKRKIVYSVNAYLDKDILFVKNIIENKSKNDTYMYWWSNIAVPENKDTRVIAPAEEAFIASYANCSYILGKVNYPFTDGADCSYASNVLRCRDFFYKIPNDKNKWIAAVNGDGRGLLQFSTPNLKGRKMFAWGQKTGGRHWNEWLSDTKKPYIEIQAGLLNTQLEHFVMEKESEISFIEGYTSFEGDSAVLHGDDYNSAIDCVNKTVLTLIPRIDSKNFSLKEKEIVYFGSGYGALEEKIRKEKISGYFDFPKTTMNENQEYWNCLLENKPFTLPDTDKPILSYSDNFDFIEKIEKIKDKSWYDFYQLGVLYYQKKDIEKSKLCFEKSLEKRENVWALRNIMQLYLSEEKDFKKATDSAFKVIKLKNDHLALCVDTGEVLIKCGAFERYEELYNLFSEKIKKNGRIMLQFALSKAKTGKKEEAEEIVKNLTVDDIKEGEYTLSNLWMLIHSDGKTEMSEEEIFEKYPLPYQLDFRMH